MAEVTMPGVYVEELAGDRHTIAGASTSTPVFMGNSLSGAAGSVLEIQNLDEFERNFGGLSPGSQLGYAVLQFFRNGGSRAFVVRCEDDFNFSVLDDVAEFNLLSLPGESDPKLLSRAESYCRQRHALLIIDPPEHARTPAQVRDLVAKAWLPMSSYAALYYPWLKIEDPMGGAEHVLVAPSGTVAGLYARTDAMHGVWKAPAGVQSRLSGVEELAFELSDDEQSTLNDLGVNCFRAFRDLGIVCWGARTLDRSGGAENDWKFVNVRRVSNFIKRSVYDGIQWAVFEPNSERLWAQLRQSITAIMTGLYRQGAFQGATPDEAFYVKCDAETTTGADVLLGIVNIQIGFAPVKPAEFVIIRLRQKAAES